MTDSEKLDLILIEMQGMKTDIQDLQGMKTDMQGMKTDIQGMKADIRSMNIRIDNLESQMKQTEQTLRKEIRKECGLVLDEVERVHSILDRHKADKSVHTA